MLRKAFRYRLYPNKEQQAGLTVQFGHARFVYNWVLAVRNNYQCKREYPPPLGGGYSITKERNTGDGSERSPFDFCHFP